MQNRIRWPALGLTLAWISASGPATVASAVKLIDDGVTRCTIVVPREDASILRAAEDLRDHLRTMSGAEVPILHDASGVAPRHVGIYVDTKPLGVHVPGRLVDRKRIWPDGYVIEVIEFDGRQGVFLSSPRPEGVVNAVYGLLEDHLGCRWFTIGPMGEHIPRRTTVELDVPGGRDVARPSFEKRSPWYDMNAIGRTNAPGRWTREEIAWLNQWYRRNRAGGARGSTAHAWDRIYTPAVRDAVDEDGDGVSDLAVFFDGRRRPEVGGLCMSNPHAVSIAVRYFLDYFKGHPHEDHASFFQADGADWCRCPACLAMGANDGARMLTLSNRIAESVATAHPDKRILISAYAETRSPPPRQTLRAHPNLITHLCSLVDVDHIQAKTADNRWNNEYRRQAEGWAGVAPALWTCDYLGWTNGPWPLFHALQETRDFYGRLGGRGVVDEYLSRNLGTDICMWLTLRTSWDSSLRVADLLETFYPAYFGAAADDMRWIYEKIERHMLSLESGGSVMHASRTYPPSLLKACLDRIGTAKRKSADNPTVTARIQRDEDRLTATRLWVRFCLALARASGDDRREATEACRAYVDFVRSLHGTMTLGGKARHIAEQMLEALDGAGTYFAESWRGHPWPGRFRYHDNLDQGGKSFHARRRSGFEAGPYGLYLEGGATGEIIYDVRLAGGLRFKEVYLPGGPGGCDLAIKLALPKGGHNGIELSLDDGRSWTTAFRDLVNRGDQVKFDLTRHAGGANRFLLKFWVHNNTEAQILAMDCWTITGIAEPDESPPR